MGGADAHFMKMESNQKIKRQKCLNCSHDRLRTFYEVENIPANTMIQISTKKESLNYPTGKIALAYCEKCSFVSNLSLNQELIEYSSRYESTQAYSETFLAFNRNLAETLVDKYSLYNKKIIEIGCGDGEFLREICNLGFNRGIGFDPSYSPGGVGSGEGENLIFIKDYFSRKYDQYQADFYICKMTLEHIHDTSGFISDLKESIHDPEAVVFFQVPDFRKILREIAIWDIYYEHCSYFTQESLVNLFRMNGFEVINLWQGFDEQYLMVEAQPSRGIGRFIGTPNIPDDLLKLINAFRNEAIIKRNHLMKKMKHLKRMGKKTVIWGASSRGVSFATTLGLGAEIIGAVDINPQKRGMFLPGTSSEIFSPEDLKGILPDVVLLMNPIYWKEVIEQLDALNLSPEVISVQNV